ncbi:hypothetical protein C8Q70DRAFT_150206 [Cubamyces menziesii]|nr:hypothetical protein C8Q70DRAFT_150206 [Cubamyces menziesii]
MKQQKSSGSEGRERNPRGEMDKTKERAEMSRDKQLKVSERDSDRKDNDVGAQEMRRMPSEGTALSAESTSGVVLGRHGTRVEGDRVLLPARKVTRKRVDTATTSASASSSRRDETGAEDGRGAASGAQKARRERERGGEGGGEGEREEQVRVVGDRVLLPARKMTRPRVDAASLPQSGSPDSSSATGTRSQAKDTGAPSELTASTSTSTPVQDVRPSLEGLRKDNVSRATAASSSNTATTSSGPDRVPINGEARRERRRKEKKHGAEDASAARTEYSQAHARMRSPEPQVNAGQTSSSSGSHAPYIAFPASGPSLLSGDSTNGWNGGGSGGSGGGATAVIVVDGEDQFSTPKRARMHTIATSKPASPPALSAAASASNSAGPSSQPRPLSPIKQHSRPGAQKFIKESIDEGDKAAADGAASSTAPASSLTSPAATSGSHSNSKENAPAPRRRKYSLLAVFGLPVGKNMSDSDRDTSTATGHSRDANATPSTSNTKPPTPPPPPSTASSPPAVSGGTPARDASDEARTEDGLPSKKEEKRRVPVHRVSSLPVPIQPLRAWVRVQRGTACSIPIGPTSRQRRAIDGRPCRPLLSLSHTCSCTRSI